MPKRVFDVKWFDSLSRRDFENGATLDEIRRIIKERDVLKEQVAKLQTTLEGLRKDGLAF